MRLLLIKMCAEHKYFVIFDWIEKNHISPLPLPSLSRSISWLRWLVFTKMCCEFNLCGMLWQHRLLPIINHSFSIKSTILFASILLCFVHPQHPRQPFSFSFSFRNLFNLKYMHTHTHMEYKYRQSRVVAATSDKCVYIWLLLLSFR